MYLAHLQYKDGAIRGPTNRFESAPISSRNTCRLFLARRKSFVFAFHCREGRCNGAERGIPAGGRKLSLGIPPMGMEKSSE